MSPACGKIWSKAPETLYEDPKSFMDAVHPEDREKVLAPMAEHAEGKWHIEYRIQKPDGFPCWIHDRGFPVYDEKQKLCFMVGIATDITEAKNAAEEPARKNEELQNFSYVASHDLQEPLRKVTTFASILREEYAETLDDQGKDFIGIMVEATRRMQTLLASLLQYSKIGWGSENLGTVDLNKGTTFEIVLPLKQTDRILSENEQKTF